MVHVQNSSSKKWIPILGALTVATLAAAWWGREHMANEPSAVTDAAPVTAAATTATPATPAAAPAPVAITPAATPEQQQEAQRVLAEQQAAAQELEKMAEWRVLKGPITERPAFASVMEWQMLKAVAERQPNGQAELTRLTNFLRYTKLLEKWQDLPASADAGQRQPLAAQLSSELALHVREGDVDVKDAQRQLPALLRDAYPTEAQRDSARKKLSADLAKAQADYTQAAAAATTAPQ
jgi:hypothetical protein